MCYVRCKKRNLYKVTALRVALLHLFVLCNFCLRDRKLVFSVLSLTFVHRGYDKIEYWTENAKIARGVTTLESWRNRCNLIWFLWQFTKPCALQNSAWLKYIYGNDMKQMLVLESLDVCGKLNWRLLTIFLYLDAQVISCMTAKHLLVL